MPQANTPTETPGDDLMRGQSPGDATDERHDAFHAALGNVSVAPRADTAIEEAADLLERSLRHERWGVSAQDYAAQAVPLLRAAGRGDLADRLEDDPWGGEVEAVLAEVTDALSCYRALERR